MWPPSPPKNPPPKFCNDILAFSSRRSLERRKRQLTNLNLAKECDFMKLIKKIAVLVAPLLLFAVLLIPYRWANQQFIVEWFGCGCPVFDEFGNMVKNNFNANDFTALFWLFISICATVISVLLSKRILKETIWLRVLYIVGMLVVSLFITYQFYRMMMWN